MRMEACLFRILLDGKTPFPWAPSHSLDVAFDEPYTSESRRAGILIRFTRKERQADHPLWTRVRDRQGTPPGVQRQAETALRASTAVRDDRSREEFHDDAI